MIRSLVAGVFMLICSQNLMALEINMLGVDDQVDVYVNDSYVKSWVFKEHGVLYLDQFLKAGANTINVMVYDNDYGGCWGIDYYIGSKREKHTSCDHRATSSKLVFSQKYTYNYQPSAAIPLN